ncbi:MAG: Na(+)-translocating NADH-quinone reductase subunit A [Pseudomonadota bacterium]
MRHYALSKGLNLPITGAAGPEIKDPPRITRVAVLGDDYIGLKPRISAEEGEKVVAGTPMLTDKTMPDVKIVSPVSGTVVEINRGARRKLISIVVEVDEAEDAPIDFSKDSNTETREGLTELLCKAGLWSSFRTRPYSKVAMPGSLPEAIYITATDTEPLAANPADVIALEAEAFAAGAKAVSGLCEGKTFVCTNGDGRIPSIDGQNIETVSFTGPHPAGLAGTHMHFLVPPNAAKTVWTIGYHDVITIGRLLLTGQYDPSRVIALCGPACSNPRIVKVPAGASMEQLFDDDIVAELPVRMISGSVLSGKAGEGADAYLGRYARQATLMEEDHKQIPMGWIRPMASKYSFQPVLGSAFVKKLYALTTNLNGGRRAMVPIGTFEELMPQDYLPTQLLRALLVMDTDQAQALGALELDEEDLGLLGFACPAKYEYGMALRDCLSKIEKEG